MKLMETLADIFGAEAVRKVPNQAGAAAGLSFVMVISNAEFLQVGPRIIADRLGEAKQLMISEIDEATKKTLEIARKWENEREN